jgi:hypothetical protein
MRKQSDRMHVTVPHSRIRVLSLLASILFMMIEHGRCASQQWLLALRQASGEGECPTNTAEPMLSYSYATV